MPSLRILYIHPHHYKQTISDVCIPVGVIGLINLLRKHKFDVDGINLVVEKKLDKEFNIENLLREKIYDVFLIDYHWSTYSYTFLEVCNQIKSISPQSWVVVGGLSASIFANEIMHNHQVIDFIICGDAEVSLLLLIRVLSYKNNDFQKIPNLYYRKDRQVFKSLKFSQTKNIDKLNFVDISWLNNKDSFLSFQGSTQNCKLAWIPIARGCFYNCSYCGGNNKVFKDKYGYTKIVLRSASKIFSDLSQFYQQGVSQFGTTHDLSLFGDKYWKELFDYISFSNMNISFFFSCFQLPNMEFTQRFVQLFNHPCTLYAIPIISGDEQIRKKNGKVFSNHSLIEILSCFVDSEIQVSLFFIDNIVGSYETHFNKSIELVDKIFYRYGNKIKIQVGYGFEFLQPYSPLFLNHFSNRYSKTNDTSVPQPIWTQFNDYYHRFSPSFESFIKENKRISNILGHTVQDNKLLNRVNSFRTHVAQLKENSAKMLGSD